jgi:hypothetical protein
MKTYSLKTKETKETIRKVECISLEDAIDFFSKIKQLTKEVLLKIFIVTDKFLIYKYELRKYKHIIFNNII